MTPLRMTGILMLVAGVILLIVGLSASNSVGDEVSQAVTGSVTDATAWYIYGGLAVGVVGLLFLIGGGKRLKHA